MIDEYEYMRLHKMVNRPWARIILSELRNGPKNVTELSIAIRKGHSHTSQMLGRLREAGYVDSSHADHGPKVTYSLTGRTFEDTEKAFMKFLRYKYADVKPQ